MTSKVLLLIRKRRMAQKLNIKMKILQGFSMTLLFVASYIGAVKANAYRASYNYKGKVKFLITKAANHTHCSTGKSYTLQYVNHTHCSTGKSYTLQYR